MKAVRIILVFVLFFNLVPVNAVLGDQEPVSLFASEDSKEPFHDGEVIIDPQPKKTTPNVDLRPPGFKEYMYDTGIWYGVQWGARMYWVRDKSLKIFNTSFSKWWDNITTKPVWDDGDTFFINWVAHPFFGMLSYQFYRARGHSRWSSALGLLFKAHYLNMRLRGLQ